MEERVSDIVQKLRDSREKSDLFRCQRLQKMQQKELNLRERELDLKEKSLSDSELIKQKQVAYYSHQVSAFLSTRMELDKSLLTLSVAGLGFLLSFIKVESNNNSANFFFFTIAALSFFFCILAVISIFEKNSKLIIGLSNNDEKETKKKLKRLDKIAKWTFMTGVFLSMSLVIASQYEKLNDSPKENPTKKTESTLVDVNMKNEGS